MTDWTPHTARAKAWFEHLRDSICAEFEAIEREYAGPEDAPRFQYTPWQRATVEGEAGGDTGGGATLTPTGREILARYQRMERACLAATRADWRALQKLLR